MPPAVAPLKVIPRRSHMFAMRQERPRPPAPRESRPVSRGVNYGGSGFASAGGGGLYGDFQGAWNEINAHGAPPNVGPFAPARAG